MLDQTPELPPIDLTALKVNQAFIILLLILAFILNLTWLVLVVFLMMALGTLVGVPGFKPLYQYILKPTNIAKPEIVRDNPEPHRFAQGFGAAVLLVAFLALLGDSTVLGWLLSWLVVALAAINLFAGFCVGCFVYYWLNRLGVPGFIKAPPPNTIPGMRPPLGA
jgi:Domain of unknown function (DUF4395)